MASPDSASLLLLSASCSATKSCFMTKQIQCLRHSMCMCVCMCMCLGSMYFCLDPNPKGDISLVGGSPSPLCVRVFMCVFVLRALGSARKPRQALPRPLTHDCLLAQGSCTPLIQTADRRTNKRTCTHIHAQTRSPPFPPVVNINSLVCLER